MEMADIFEEVMEAHSQGKPSDYLAKKYRDNEKALRMLVLAYRYLSAATREKTYDLLKSAVRQEDAFRAKLGSIEAMIGTWSLDPKVVELILVYACMLDRLSVDPYMVAVGNPQLLEEANLVSSRLRRMAQVGL